MTETYPEAEFTAFIDRVQRRQRHGRGRRRLQAERWIEPVAVTRQKAYDAETEHLRAQLHNHERKAS